MHCHCIINKWPTPYFLWQAARGQMDKVIQVTSMAADIFEGWNLPTSGGFEERCRRGTQACGATDGANCPRLEDATRASGQPYAICSLMFVDLLCGGNWYRWMVVNQCCEVQSLQLSDIDSQRWESLLSIKVRENTQSRDAESWMLRNQCEMGLQV